MASDDEEMDVNEEDETSSDTSEDEEIDDNKQEAELTALRDAVKSNPYDYQAHINYITLARQYTNLDHLRLARQTMSDIFPLTSQLWLDWIQDEKLLLIASTEENQDLIQLFERAINDYLSVMIWIEYVQYRIPYCADAQSMENLRNLFERGLSSCGVHLTDGSLLWAAYIETEKAILDGIRLNYHQNSSNNDLKEKVLQHVDYVLKLYRRQFSIPLRDMKNIYSKDYQEFCAEYKEFLPANYHEQFHLTLKRDFDKAIEQLEQCEKFETELDQTERSVSTYRKYIQFEKEPARIQCLYERAIVDKCLDGDLWLSYLDFAEEHISSTTLLQTIFERSLRNCPWVSTLSIRYAEYMEFTKLADHTQLKKIYDRALNSDPTNLISFVDIQLAYLQYRRRHYDEQVTLSSKELDSLKEEIRHICEYACDQYQEFFSSADPNLFLKYNAQLELFWIHLEIQSFHSIEHAREIWNGRTLMSKTHNQMISNLWKNYYYTELHYADDKHARKVLYRALNHVHTMDYPLSICDLLLEHEKKYGTIQQLKETNEKLREVKKKIMPVEKPKRQQQQPNAKKGKQKDVKEKPKKVPKNQMDTNPVPVQTNGKSTEQQQVSPRKRKLSPKEETNAKKKPPPTTPIIDSEGFKIPALPPPSLPSSSSSTTAKPPNKNTDHLNTVFVANLAYDVNEDAIRQALSSAGPIKEIRIVKHEWSGKSKGFGYVDFTTTEGCRQALKLDHTLINGRPMYVSMYDPHKSASTDMTKKFKYATSLEQNKLFLSGLPFSATKEQIEHIFKEKGFQAKDVRLVTQKSGKPKGLAYAEFDDAQTASQAVLKVDGTELDGHTIKVAISNPPQRKEPAKSNATDKAILARVTSLGEAPKPAGPRGKGHSQIALVPRKIATANTKPINQSAAVSSSSSTTTSTTSSMNNDDFRNMLLNKK